LPLKFIVLPLQEEQWVPEQYAVLLSLHGV